jgi:hypothetical protein
MKVLVEFTKDFAGKKKGDKESYDGMLASVLIRKDKVAKIFKESKKAPKK